MLDFSDKNQRILNVFNFKTDDFIFSEAKQIIVTDGFNLQTKHRKSGSQKQLSWTDISKGDKKSNWSTFNNNKTNPVRLERNCSLKKFTSWLLWMPVLGRCTYVFDEHRSEVAIALSIKILFLRKKYFSWKYLRFLSLSIVFILILIDKLLPLTIPDCCSNRYYPHPCNLMVRMFHVNTKRKALWHGPQFMELSRACLQSILSILRERNITYSLRWLFLALFFSKIYNSISLLVVMCTSNNLIDEYIKDTHACAEYVSF